jgi:hypothetical protein
MLLIILQIIAIVASDDGAAGVIFDIDGHFGKSIIIFGNSLFFFFHQRRAHIFPFAVAVYHHALVHAEPIHDIGVSHRLLSF